MKVNGPSRIGAINQYSKQQETPNPAAAGKKGSKKDQVEISNEAKELLGTMRSSEASKVSAERIEELKNAVEAGTYKVDARALAEKIFPFLK
ncbi:flagellar biosynthesis anti-sigma factor FlgM [Paenibacillus ginsengihumi]|uniref:flagellar biosynthesis anti-sigma factor FlgM n=1 Tax=Paenibacillus ginsengihumi TaxID=431596 RepID=UPI00035E5BB5|nr:flagellar biosynthesis anti-sigma factor FlgM [Paenibacillus ginsengihumi]